MGWRWPSPVFIIDIMLRRAQQAPTILENASLALRGCAKVHGIPPSLASAHHRHACVICADRARLRSSPVALIEHQCQWRTLRFLGNLKVGTGDLAPYRPYQLLAIVLLQESGNLIGERVIDGFGRPEVDLGGGDAGVIEETLHVFHPRASLSPQFGASVAQAVQREGLRIDPGQTGVVLEATVHGVRREGSIRTLDTSFAVRSPEGIVGTHRPRQSDGREIGKECPHGGAGKLTQSTLAAFTPVAVQVTSVVGGLDVAPTQARHLFAPAPCI